MFPYLRPLLFAVSIVLLYVFWEWGGATALIEGLHPHGSVEVRAVGKPAPTLRVPKERMANQQEFVLSSLRGYPVIVHFWATWCAPCLQELPELLRLTQKLRARGFSVVAVAVDENWEKLDQFFAKNPDLAPMKQQMILVLDPEGAIAESFGSRRFPETYLINSELVIDNKLIGPQPWNDAAMEPYLARLKK